MTFTAGWNQPGYLPTCEPVEFDTFDEAVGYLEGIVENSLDEDYDAVGTKVSSIKARAAVVRTWMPVQVELGLARVTDPSTLTFDATTGDGKFAFWIVRS